MSDDQVHDHLKQTFLRTYSEAKAAMRAYAASGSPGDSLLFHDALEAAYRHSEARVAYIAYLEAHPQTPLT